MSYKLKVKPSDEINTWLIFVDSQPVSGFNANGDALLALADGRHRLSYKINGPGGSIELDIAEKPTIILPEGATWPITRKVPDGQTGATDAIYFRTGQ